MSEGVRGTWADRLRILELDGPPLRQAYHLDVGPIGHARARSLDREAFVEGNANVWVEMSRARYAELEALPAEKVGQIVDGELVVSPRPSGEHTLASDAIRYALAGPLQYSPQGGWWITNEREVHLGADVLVPDVGGWRKVRLALPSGPFETIAPDWVCEALSPSTVKLDRFAKMAIYAREGVGHVWLVDPVAHTLEAYRRDGSAWVCTGVWRERARVRAEPFAEVEIDLAMLWPEA